jgi:hypothetical protein
MGEIPVARDARADDDAVEVAHREQRQVLQAEGVALELVEGGAQVLPRRLYSRAKWPRFHTSAQPRPPAVLVAPFSKA